MTCQSGSRWASSSDSSPATTRSMPCVWSSVTCTMFDPFARYARLSPTCATSIGSSGVSTASVRVVAMAISSDRSPRASAIRAMIRFRNSVDRASAGDVTARMPSETVGHRDDTTRPLAEPLGVHRILILRPGLARVSDPGPTVGNSHLSLPSIVSTRCACALQLSMANTLRSPHDTFRIDSCTPF